MVAAPFFFFAETSFFGIILHLATLPAVGAELISKDLVGGLELLAPIAFSYYFARKLIEDALIWVISLQLIMTVLYGTLVAIIFMIGIVGKDAIQGGH